MSLCKAEQGGDYDKIREIACAEFFYAHFCLRRTAEATNAQRMRVCVRRRARDGLLTPFPANANAPV